MDYLNYMINKTNTLIEQSREALADPNRSKPEKDELLADLKVLIEMRKNYSDKSLNLKA